MGKPKIGRHVALLRGINVGGKNKLPMKDLREIVVGIGAKEVASYIQSGNVVFSASPTVARRAAKAIQDVIATRFELSIPVITRSAEELRAVVAENPFLGESEETSTLHVAFLGDRPLASRVASLDHDRSPPDRFVASGKEIYLCFPNGTAKSKLTNAYFDARLQTVSSVRNWRTVLKLVEMLGAEAKP